MDSDPGATPVQSGRRTRKGKNDDELNPDGEEVSARETNEQHGEQSEESGAFSSTFADCKLC